MAGSLRDIELFVAAFEEGSFTTAAERECCTQSGVSQHIHKLETALGTKLFMRMSGRVTPTPAGAVYYESCVEILKRHSGAALAMRPFSGSLNGELTIGLMPTLTRTTLAPALVTFTEQHANLSVRIVEGYSGSLTRMVSSGELDFAIVPLATTPVGLRSKHFLAAPEVLVSRKGSEPAARRSDRANENAVKMIFPSSTHARHMMLWDYLRANAVNVSRSIELDSMYATLDLIARSDWKAVLPLLLLRPAEDIAKYDIVRVDPGLELRLMCLERARQPLSSAAEIFLDALREECEQVARSWDQIL